MVGSAHWQNCSSWLASQTVTLIAFDDTFAIELLLSGVSLEHVSVLLGHQSIRITERHYAAWVRARQEQLEADVRRTWGADLLTQPDFKGTRRVHGEETRPN